MYDDEVAHSSAGEAGKILYTYLRPETFSVVHS
jgi:hypothetical protein